MPLSKSDIESSSSSALKSAPGSPIALSRTDGHPLVGNAAVSIRSETAVSSAHAADRTGIAPGPHKASVLHDACLRGDANALQQLIHEELALVPGNGQNLLSATVNPAGNIELIRVLAGARPGQSVTRCMEGHEFRDILGAPGCFSGLSYAVHQTWAQSGSYFAGSSKTDPASSLGTLRRAMVVPDHALEGGAGQGHSVCGCEGDASEKTGTKLGADECHSAGDIEVHLPHRENLQEKVYRFVNARDYCGNTPLHWAAFRGHDRCLQLLVSAGADPTIRDKGGRLALHDAASRGHAKCTRLLLEALGRVVYPECRGGGADSLTGCRCAAERRLCASGNNFADFVNAKDSYGLTPLHYATRNGDFACVRALLDAGANADEKAFNGDFRY